MPESASIIVLLLSAEEMPALFLLLLPSYSPSLGKVASIERRSAVTLAEGHTSTQIANSAFTWGTASVLSFYTLMVVAPTSAFASQFHSLKEYNCIEQEHARKTRRNMVSCVPYVALAVLYVYLLHLSWTPDALRISELDGMARLFTNEITSASAWIRLLTVDLLAARFDFNFFLPFPDCLLISKKELCLAYSESHIL
ncbi:hypothetical protein ZIOFF_012356 [Zingiber officinale]|uniref:Uncharacterized protein n=1 Tax=Zingiber officinale TaxID=94328 RepID=A0A8J5M3C4_ZINOF|nr:hypothetical protein ZIOFF_012356 [Zingiber officinale]